MLGLWRVLGRSRDRRGRKTADPAQAGANDDDDGVIEGVQPQGAPFNWNKALRLVVVEETVLGFPVALFPDHATMGQVLETSEDAEGFCLFGTVLGEDAANRGTPQPSMTFTPSGKASRNLRP